MFDKGFKTCGMCGCYTPFLARVADHCDAHKETEGEYGW